MKKTIVVSGKRKRAIARAKITKGTGKVIINGKALDAIEPVLYRMKIQEPVFLAGEKYLKDVDIIITVTGGGVAGQADAARLALAKALVAWHNDDALEKTFSSYDRTLLVADVRRKEPRKPNDSKARAKRQKSYR